MNPQCPHCRTNRAVGTLPDGSFHCFGCKLIFTEEPMKIKLEGTEVTQVVALTGADVVAVIGALEGYKASLLGELNALGLDPGPPSEERRVANLDLDHVEQL